MRDGYFFFRPHRRLQCLPTRGARLMAKILIVDDDKNSRQLFVSLLSPFGHQVVEAGDGKEGLEQARVGEPNLIITDILMPTMNGYDFVSNVRKCPALETVPIIFHSATF